MTADRIPALLEPIQNRLAEVGKAQNTRVDSIALDGAVFRSQSDVARLLAAVQAVTGIAEIKMNSEHGDPAFVQGWEAAIEEMNARLVAALGGEA
jgi:hypothetical protein